MSMELTPQEEQHIIQKRTALAQLAVSALYSDSINQQERSGLLPENLSLQTENLSSAAAASQVSPHNGVATSPLNGGGCGAEAGVAVEEQSTSTGAMSALQLQQLQQVSVIQQV